MSSEKAIRVGILMGSASDWETMKNSVNVLEEFKIPNEVRVLSAHRTPNEAVEWITSARDRGVQVVICAAGLAAHLAGVAAAHTTLPVIGVPMAGGSLGGFDALLSTVQMPKGTPVATVAVGSAGAVNSALLAIRIMALSDSELLAQLEEYQKQMAAQVIESGANLK
jgi:phosphoribosylaminoimidazole carboxylase PurE protein